MDLISKRDALDKVHKTIENLILRLPKVRGVDGEDYCTDPASLAAYNMAYEHISREIESIPPWNTEESEVVRCGECVNWKEDFPYNTCELFGGRWNENMFCWYGERKDD
jgi:hypothetical protein